MTIEELEKANRICKSIEEAKEKLKCVYDIKERIFRVSGPYQKEIAIKIGEEFLYTPKPLVSLYKFVLFIDSEITRYEEEINYLEKQLADFHTER